jgi:hypothetical protein
LAAFFHFNFFESRASSPRVPVVSTPRAVSRRAIGVLTLFGCYSTVAGSNPSELNVVPETSRDGFAVYEPTNRSGPVGGPFFTDFTDMASDRGGMPVPAPAPSPSPDTKDDAEQGSRFGWPTDDESRFVARGQATYAWIRKFGFDARTQDRKAWSLTRNLPTPCHSPVFSVSVSGRAANSISTPKHSKHIRFPICSG